MKTVQFETDDGVTVSARVAHHTRCDEALARTGGPEEWFTIDWLDDGELGEMQLTALEEQAIREAYPDHRWD